MKQILSSFGVGDMSVPTVNLFDSLVIGDNSIEGYKIVYAQSEYAQRAAQKPQYYPVWDFNRETAERVADLFFKYSGVRLSVFCDTEIEWSDKEILIGKTDRSYTDEFSLNSSEYKIAVKDENLIIVGGAYGTTWHAIDYIEMLFESERKKGCSDFVFASDFEYNGSYKLLTIGCIGDSITYGRGCENRLDEAYPAHLQRILWKDVVTVYNFGVSGRTMLSGLVGSRRDGTKVSATWRDHENYDIALGLTPKIDIFTIALGSNDSNRVSRRKPPLNIWTDKESEDYKRDYESLMRSFCEKNSSLRFIIINAPACFGESITKNYASNTIRMLQAELVGELSQKGYDVSFYDMYSATKNLSDYFPDELHPDSDGTMIIAKDFSRWLNAYIDSIK